MAGPRAIAPLAAVLALALPAVASAASPPPLHIADGRIADARGAQVILHGVNVVYKLPPYLPHGRAAGSSFDSRDVRRIRSWGMNAIRLGVSWKALAPQRGQFSNRYAKAVAHVVRRAERGGLYVLLDMHQDLWSEEFQGNGAPGWATITDGLPFTPSASPFPGNYLQPAVGRAFTSFWDDVRGIRSQYVAAYTSLARMLRRDRGVLGYDLFNEPVCELGRPSCAFPPTPAAAARYLQPFYDQIVPAMRRADPAHPSFYEDGVTTNFGYPFLIGTPPAPRWPFENAGLSHHVYCSPQFRPGVSCPQQERDALQNAHSAARRNGVAPLVTEWGATDDLAVLRRVAREIDTAGEGWLYWQYKTYRDPTTQASSEAGGADAESLVSDRGHVKQAKLRVLARVYPTRIAGSDARWRYDDRNRRFTLSYRPDRGAGRTVIAVPDAVYRRGWHARVRGGRPGKPRHGRFSVTAARHASRVVVSVRPR